MSALVPGNVAVVTGAAAGIGLALAHEAARRGLKVVLSDVRKDALAAAVATLAGEGHEVLAVPADVTSERDVQALAAAAVERFGRVNVLVNNAGAFIAGLAWETPEDQFDWIIDLNFKSVARGIRAFVSRMIAQGDACHVVTVASGAALTVYPGYSTYSSTKHAALALTEALYLDLIAEGIENVGVTIAMPGMIRTDIMTPEKTSPKALSLDRETRHVNATVRGIERMMAKSAETAMAPADLAERLFDAVAAGRLYTLPNHEGEYPTGMAKAIALGRATGVDTWRTTVAGMLDAIAKNGAAALG